jgi:hypothetical protein
MKIVYQSPNYKAKIITNRYLSIDRDGVVNIFETKKVFDCKGNLKTNYTYRQCEYNESECGSYAKELERAKKLTGYWPNQVEIKEVCQ